MKYGIRNKTLTWIAVTAFCAQIFAFLHVKKPLHFHDTRMCDNENQISVFDCFWQNEDYFTGKSLLI